ncbi:MAG TPA: hypothetical protein VK066_32200 [Chloroflexota bacterium]|nr:hypothetical protein [Chloroflexota bacterium]
MQRLKRWTVWRGMLILAALVWGWAASPAAYAWPGVVEGRPTMFQPGARGGYYIWHNEDEDTHWHIETTDRPGFNHLYTGAIRTDGTFVNVSGVQSEGDDWVRQEGNGVLRFHFHTFSGIDGVRFSIDGGSTLAMNLFRDDAPVALDRIYLGRDGSHPRSNPVRFNR